MTLNIICLLLTKGMTNDAWQSLFTNSLTNIRWITQYGMLSSLRDAMNKLSTCKFKPQLTCSSRRCGCAAWVAAAHRIAMQQPDAVQLRCIVLDMLVPLFVLYLRVCRTSVWPGH